MLNKEKIRLMTDLAVYEKLHDDDVFKINNYYRSDYIIWGILLAIARYTLCFLMLFALYVIFKADIFFYNINLTGIRQTLVQSGFAYLAGLAVYVIVAYIVYARRYKRARKGILLYAIKLKRLAKHFGMLGD